MGSPREARKELIARMQAALSSVDEGLDQLEERLHGIAERKDEMVEALKHEVEAWQGRIEGLHVQASLAGADIQDEVRAALRRVDHAVAALRRELTTARDDTALTLDDVVAALHRSRRELGRAFEAVQAALREQPAA